MNVIFLLLLVELKSVENASLGLSTLIDVQNGLKFGFGEVEDLRGNHDEKRNAEGAPNGDNDCGDLSANCVWKDVSVTYCSHCDDRKPNSRAIVR